MPDPWSFINLRTALIALAVIFALGAAFLPWQRIGEFVLVLAQGTGRAARATATGIGRLPGLVRQMFSPRFNNSVFFSLLTGAGICAVLALLLIPVAIYHGGGEPLGIRALKDIGVHEESPTTKQFYDSPAARQILTGSREAPKKQTPPPAPPTWGYWTWVLYSAVLTLGLASLTFIWGLLFAFWDEVRDAYQKVKERSQQEPMYVRLRPEPKEPSPQPPPPQPPRGGRKSGQQTGPAAAQPPQAEVPEVPQGLWERMKPYAKPFALVLSAEFVGEVFEQIIRRRFRRAA